MEQVNQDQLTPLKYSGCWREKIAIHSNWPKTHRHGLVVCGVDGETQEKVSEFVIFFTTYLDLSNYLHSYLLTHEGESVTFSVQIWEYKDDPRLVNSYTV